MEQHFRKSLGEDYSKLFKEKSDKGKSEAVKDAPQKMEVDDVKSYKDDMTGFTGIIKEVAF